MNIVLAADNNYVQHCGVTMMSILKNNEDIHFYLFTEGLTEQNEDILKNLVLANGGNIDFCNVPSDIVNKFPMSKFASHHISIATYYRLFISSLLPENISKVIYFDCDMVITGSLNDLWNTSIEGFALGAVYQHLGWSDYARSWERLNIPRNEGYFNAGMLLMNIDFLRHDNFQTRAIKYINENIDKIVSHDQDVLNALYYNKTKPISCRWNFLPLFMSKIDSTMFSNKFNYVNDVKEVNNTPVVIHYVSKPKPWQYGCTHKYKKEYFKYLSYTPWHEYRPKFMFSLFFRDFILPNIKKCVRKFLTNKC